MNSSDWPCPQDLVSGERVEITHADGGGMILMDTVYSANRAGFLLNKPGTDPVFYKDVHQKYVWRRAEAARATWPSMQAAAPVRYGATCRKCNEHYEHAEWRSGFVCHSCKVWSSL